MSLQDNVQKQLDALPPEIKELLHSTEVDVIVQQIGAKNKLHLDQTDILLAEINQTMKGRLAAEDFTKELMSVFQMDEAHAAAIAKDVDEMLFSKIRSAMQKNYDANKAPAAPIKEAIEPRPSAPTPMPTPAPAPKAPLASVLPVSSSTPAATPTPATPVVATSPATTSPEMHAAEVMMREKTVEVAPQPAAPKAPVAQSAPSTPPIYKKDPYREPVEEK